MRFSQILSDEQLEKLPTHRLKAYLDVVNACRDQVDWDLQERILMGTAPAFPNRPNDELTKRNPVWMRLHSRVKKILDGREHLTK